MVKEEYARVEGGGVKYVQKTQFLFIYRSLVREFDKTERRFKRWKEMRKDDEFNGTE